MNSNKLSLLLAPVLIGMLPVSASANDIVDFLRALQGPPQELHYHNHDIEPVGRHHHGYDPVPVRLAARHRVAQRAQCAEPPVVLRRPGTSFSVRFGSSPYHVPPAPVFLPQTPPPVIVHPAPVYPAPVVHQPGDIVTCPVVLETCVVVKDEDEIAPGACPIVVAVTDPHVGRYQNHLGPAPVVFVEVYAPPCPPERVTVSKCGTKIRLDYGQFEIDIVSRNGVVELDYDN